jgi:phage portal protein BeeE
VTSRPFDFISDVAACLETSGQRLHPEGQGRRPGRRADRDRPRPGRGQARAGQKVFVVRDANGGKDTWTASTILHVRGFTVNGSDLGISPIQAHKTKLGSIQSRDEFEGRFFGQGMNAGVAVEIPPEGRMTEDDQKNFMRRWIANHTGMRNSHLPVLLTNGAKISKLGLTLEEAQFVESES